jgi:hypothetical protein
MSGTPKLKSSEACEWGRRLFSSRPTLLCAEKGWLRKSSTRERRSHFFSSLQGDGLELRAAVLRYGGSLSSPP